MASASGAPLLVVDDKDGHWSAEQPSQMGGDLAGQVTAARSIWRGYLYGQLANVSKAALWWSTFGILAVSMLRSAIALTVTRAPFNIALLVSSPLAVVAAERLSIRDLLVKTTVGRLCVWSLLIPCSWIVLNNVLSWPTALWIAMVIFMFADGVQVAFSNAVDIDCGGLDSLSIAYDLPLTDFLRYKFTIVHQLVFDTSFIFLTPPLTLLIMIASSKFNDEAGHTIFSHLKRLLPQRVIGSDPSVFVLSVGIATMFAILSFISLRFYSACIPKQTRLHPAEGSEHPASEYVPASQLEVADDSASNGLVSRTSRCRPSAKTTDTLNTQGLWPEVETSTSLEVSLGTAYKEKLEEVLDGLMLVLSDQALKWRLVMLAWETALEDSMVSVVIPMIALNSIEVLNRVSEDKTTAALISVIIIAVGKLGGVLAGVYLASHWHHHHQFSLKANRRLFTLVLLSSLSLVLVPWGYASAKHAIDGDLIPPPPLLPSNGVVQNVWRYMYAPPVALSCSSLLLGVFLFFIFSTAPKIWFAYLIQSLVTQEDQAAKVFGFVGMFVTVVDGVIITLVNLIFWYTGRDHFLLALWLVFAFYLAHGLFEWTLGGRLIQSNGQNRFVRSRG